MSAVYVSGATGFIAQHICKSLLAGGYKVVGSVRSAEKGKHLSQLLNSDRFTYEIVPDVQTEGAFDESLKKHPEVGVFLHTASPFHFKATDIEKELLLPAVNGTINALKAIVKYGPQVKKVVITSSYAAVGTFELESDPKHTNTEESWNTISWDDSKANPVMGYRGSKKFAEKAAWDFVRDTKPAFSINYVCPSFVFGPQAFDSEVKENLNTSSEVLNSLLNLTPDAGVPQAKGGYVDVRDVARAHIAAFEKDFANERLILNAGRFAGQDLLDVVHAEFPQLGRIPKGEPGTGSKVPFCKIDNSRTLRLLGWDLIGLRQSVRDSIQQIIDAKAARL